MTASNAGGTTGPVSSNALAASAPPPQTPPAQNPPPAVPSSPPPPPSADIAAATAAPACLTIPTVTRNQVAPVPRGGRLLLATSQVDNPAAPLRAAIRFAGSGAIRSAAFVLNGRAVTVRGRSATLPISSLRIASRRNRLTVRVTLRDGRRASVTQFFIVTRCPLPAVTCQRLADGRSLRCTSRTPLGGRRVKVTVTRSAAETARGSAIVTRGRYTVVVRSSSPLGAGCYAYKHVVTTPRRGQRFQMIRLVTVG